MEAERKVMIQSLTDLNEQGRGRDDIVSRVGDQEKDSSMRGGDESGEEII